MPSTPIFFDSHMHTPLCKHAYGQPSDYVEQGVARGLKGIIFTCHSPMPNRWSHRVRMSPEEFEDYVALVQEGADAAPEGFEVRLGMESDFFPGMENWLTELHARADFHYILGSVHWHVPEYKDAYFTGSIVDFQRQYFAHLAESAESGLFDCLAHPDLVKNADPSEWKMERIQEDVAEALDRIAKTGVAMELNTSGIQKIYPEFNPGPGLLTLMHERGIPVVIGSDSHVPHRVAADFDDALDLLESVGYQEVQVFENRKPQGIAIPDVRESMGLAAVG